MEKRERFNLKKIGLLPKRGACLDNSSTDRSLKFRNEVILVDKAFSDPFLDIMVQFEYFDGKYIEIPSVVLFSWIYYCPPCLHSFFAITSPLIPIFSSKTWEIRRDHKVKDFVCSSITAFEWNGSYGDY